MAIKFFDKDAYYTENIIPDEERAASAEFTDASIGCGDTEIRFAYTDGNLIFRYFSEDTGYYFSPPYPLSDNADPKKAFEKISEYCKIQEIPEVIVDLYDEEINMALRGAGHYDIDTDEDGMNMLRIYTECMLCDELPEVLSGDVYLGEFSLSYADKYAELVKNENLNLHFGYDLCDDIPDGTGEDFINAVREDFERGISMTFAATVLEEGENVFAGEGCLYAFDGRGGASVSFRVLPEFHRRGVGTSVFEGLLKIAEQIRLERVFADVKLENLPSLSLLSKYGEPYEKENGKQKFVLEIGKMKRYFG